MINREKEGSPLGPSLKRWSEGQIKHDFLLGYVQRLEEELAVIESFANRRSHIRKFEAECGLEMSDWRLVYAMFLGRNLHEIPERRSYEVERRKAERTVYYSGTVEKEGRNWRLPWSMAFNIRVTQKTIFRNWSWPAERKTSKGRLVSILPRDEVFQLEPVQPPRGETWESLAAAQDVSQPQEWEEEKVPAVPGLNQLRRLMRRRRR